VIGDIHRLDGGHDQPRTRFVRIRAAPRSADANPMSKVDQRPGRRGRSAAGSGMQAIDSGRAAGQSVDKRLMSAVR
jgi:hypothetical protein